MHIFIIIKIKKSLIESHEHIFRIMCIKYDIEQKIRKNFMLKFLIIKPKKN